MDKKLLVDRFIGLGDLQQIEEMKDVTNEIKIMLDAASREGRMECDRLSYIGIADELRQLLDMYLDVL